MSNPVEERINGGMSPIAAFLTDATCGEACWSAREEVCRCSCGGKNHGCMRSADGSQPERTAKIDGVRYTLAGVGLNVYADASAINKAQGYRSIDRVTDSLIYHYKWDYTDVGAPARIKKATESQIARWPELTGYKAELDRIKAGRHCWKDVSDAWPDLLWVRMEMPTPKVCFCDRCKAA